MPSRSTQLITRCPNCQTAFKVHAEQLAAKEGIVKCGRCLFIFNAHQHLVEQLTIPVNEIPAEPVETIEPTAPIVEEEDLSSMHPPLVDESLALPAEIDESETIEENAAFAATAPSLILEDFLFSQPQAKPARRIAWSLASLFLAGLLIGQLTFIYRTQFITWLPGLRPYLMRLCAPLHCQVALPESEALLSIESSDLNNHPNQPELMNLTATIRNRAAHVQRYPWLQLNLTNLQDQVVASKLFAPQTYLNAGTVAAEGLAPYAEFTVNLTLTSQIAASGYRLYLFYPQQ